MSKVSKMVWNMNNWSKAIYVKGVKRSSKYIQCTNMFLLITSLIVNGFSIQKKFWKAETEGFSAIPSNPMYVEDVKDYFDLRHALIYTVLDGMVEKL